MQMDYLFYTLEIVTEPTARMAMRSPRGVVSWEQTAPVDKLVHDEQLLRERPPMRQERIRRITRSSAWNHYMGYLSRAALNAGMEWVSLNLRGTERGFLFSTRRQKQLEEEFGEAPEIADSEGFRAHLVLDRSIPTDQCYCVKTNNARIFARYESVGSRLQIYLSRVTRIDAGQNIALADADQALRYLRRFQVKQAEQEEEERPAPPTLEARPPQAALPPPPLSEGLSSPANIPRFSWSSNLTPEKLSPEKTAEPEEAAEEIVVEEEKETPTSEPQLKLETELEETEEAQTECPSCGDDLFHIAGATSVCLSCGWSNLPDLDDEESA